MGKQEVREWLDVSGLSRKTMDATVSQPDKHEQLVVADFELDLYLRRGAATALPSTVLVVNGTQRGKSCEAGAVIKVYDDFASGLGTLTPSQLLRRFAERFGRIVHMGDEHRKIFLAETIPMRPEHLQQSVLSPRPTGYGAHTMSVVWMRRSDDGKAAVCPLILDVDARIYQAYREGRKSP